MRILIVIAASMSISLYSAGGFDLNLDGVDAGLALYAPDSSTPQSSKLRDGTSDLTATSTNQKLKSLTVTSLDLSPIMANATQSSQKKSPKRISSQQISDNVSIATATSAIEDHDSVLIINCIQNCFLETSRQIILQLCIGCGNSLILKEVLEELYTSNKYRSLFTAQCNNQTPLQFALERQIWPAIRELRNYGVDFEEHDRKTLQKLLTVAIKALDVGMINNFSSAGLVTREHIAKNHELFLTSQDEITKSSRLCIGGLLECDLLAQELQTPTERIVQKSYLPVSESNFNEFVDRYEQWLKTVKKKRKKDKKEQNALTLNDLQSRMPHFVQQIHIMQEYRASEGSSSTTTTSTG